MSDDTILPEPDENGWRPIESAPEDDMIILTDGGCLWQGFWAKGYGWIAGYWDGKVEIRIMLAPTHWQPLMKGPVT